MKSKVMTVAFVMALALSASAQNATKGSGSAISKAPTAVSTSKRLPPQKVKRMVASTAHGPNAVVGKKK